MDVRRFVLSSFVLVHIESVKLTWNLKEGPLMNSFPL